MRFHIPGKLGFSTHLFDGGSYIVSRASKSINESLDLRKIDKMICIIQADANCRHLRNIPGQLLAVIQAPLNAHIILLRIAFNIDCN